MLVIEYIRPSKDQVARRAKISCLDEIYEVDFVKELTKDAKSYTISQNLVNQKVLWATINGSTRPIAFIEEECWGHRQ